MNEQTPDVQEAKNPTAKNTAEAWHLGMRQRVEKMMHKLNAVIEAKQVMQVIAPEPEILPDSVLGRALARQEPAADGRYYALDVGCGLASRIGRRYRGKQVNVIGADPLGTAVMQSLHQVRLAQPHPNINVLGEELSLVWPPSSFHLIYSEALPFMISPAAAVAEMCRLLRPGGSLFLLLREPRPDHCWRLIETDADSLLLEDRFGVQQRIRGAFSVAHGPDSTLVQFYAPAGIIY